MKSNSYVGFVLCCFLISCTKESSFPKNGISLSGKAQMISSFGGGRNEVANAVVSTLDGGYAFAGYTQSIDGNITDKSTENPDFLIAKFSENDVLLWSKTFGGAEDDRASDIIETLDGGFAVLGYSESNDIDVSQNQGSQDFWLLKLDASGNLLWEKSFGYAGPDYGTSLIETKEGGFLITGVLDVSASGGLGNKSVASKHAGGDIWAMKLDHSGALIWQQYFGGNGTDIPFGVVATATNEFIIAGSSDSTDTDISANKGSYDFWLLKIDALGQLIWEKSFGGTGIDEARAITIGNNGNLIVVGDTRSNDGAVTSNKGGADLWMITLDTNGALISQKTFGGSSFDVARSIAKTQNNSYIISGSSRSLDGDVAKNQGQNDGWVLEVDENANLLWETAIGGSEIDFFYDAVPLNNGTVIVVGNTYSANGDLLENKGFSDVLLVKIK